MALRMFQLIDVIKMCIAKWNLVIIMLYTVGQVSAVTIIVLLLF